MFLFFLYFQKMEDCIFCKIIRGEAPSEKVWEDEEILAFKDIKPSAPVHILIVPKKHIQNLSDTSSEDQALLGKIQLTAVEIAEKLGIKDAFRVSTLNGKNAGQVVFHLHYHLMGGWSEKPNL
ncbi:MAG: Bis(5'-nucleosyl)-tetraphosphatase (asymmetrical) [Candidatus Woesebacteria bacterium]|nr:MAG: Bis(5'-nucleosyl)-tetraphosphatase (asymmetrical) [Candidatus Woesebacteria bacterium]